MPNQEDYLDRVWIRVINLDPNGKWTGKCVAQSDEPAFKGLRLALERILSHKPSFEQLGRLYRLVRYETCMAAFRALEDPGLAHGKIQGLYRQFTVGTDPKARKNLSEPLFIAALWEIVSPRDRESWMKNLAKVIPPAAAFGDVPPSLQYLLKLGINATDLDRVAIWHRYDAIHTVLFLMEDQGFDRSSQLPGLHEILLGLEPSGKEARAGSWPFLG